MNFFHKPEVKTLSEWLEIATRKLAAPAKERIKTEIESHYAESVQAHIEDGLSDLDAQAAALAELGDAQVSARRFQKRHLTQSEALKLAWSNKAGRNRLSLLIDYIVFAVFAFDQYSLLENSVIHCQYSFVFLAVEFVVLIALPTICFVLSGSNKKSPHLRLKVLMMSLSGCSEGLIINWLFMSPLGPWIHWLALLFCIVVLVNFLHSLRIWRKLGFPGAIQNELRPLDTPAPE